MASGDTEAKNRLIEHNLRLVAHIIKNIIQITPTKRILFQSAQ